jgi:alpha-tubulin suppressor-like RCC1 family protein
VVGVGDSGTLTGVKSLASAGNDTSLCALLTSGGVDCWGDNEVGELGDGSQGGSSCGDGCSPTPVQVVGEGDSGFLSGATSLVGGNSDFCALLNTGGVACWGLGREGQRGDGTQTYNVDYPVDVDTALDTPLSGAVSVLNEQGSYCAVLTGGAVDCWGDNEDADLGNGTYGPDDCDGDGCSVFAGPVVGVGDSGTLSNVSSLVGSDDGYCAVVTGGGVDCWGANFNGELGDGSSGGSSDSPVAVEGVGGSGSLTDVSSLATAADADSDCALLTSGQVNCWGANAPYGALGDGNDSASDVPASVVGVGDTGTLSGVTSLTGSPKGFCVVLGSHSTDCWGDNQSGGLGAGPNPTCASADFGCASPVAVLGLGGTGNLGGVQGIGTNLDSNCAVVGSSGNVDCWGDDVDGELGDWGAPSSSDGQSAYPVSVFAPA